MQPVFELYEMESHSMYVFASGFLHSKLGLQFLIMILQGAEACLFSLLCDILLY